MTDLPTLAATLLSNFATVRIPRCESLWTAFDTDRSLERRCRSLAIAMRAEMINVGCHRLCLRQHLLDAGHRAFLDHIEGVGPDGWRVHFFLLDPEGVAVLRDAGLGECHPGDPVAFNAEEFITRRLRQLENTDRLNKPNDWVWFFD